jgi:hypothetical protein
MLQNGWEEVDIDYDFQPKDMIKYITSNNAYSKKGGTRNVVNTRTGEDTDMVYGSFANKFRSGGWFIDIRTGTDEETNENTGDYILYKPHKTGQPPVSVQLSNINRIFVLPLSIQKELAEKKPAIYKRPGVKTEFPVTLTDNCGTKVVVYYAKDKGKYEQFTSTNKFERAQTYGWKFK